MIKKTWSKRRGSRTHICQCSWSSMNLILWKRRKKNFHELCSRPWWYNNTMEIIIIIQDCMDWLQFIFSMALTTDQHWMVIISWWWWWWWWGYCYWLANTHPLWLIDLFFQYHWLMRKKNIQNMNPIISSHS